MVSEFVLTHDAVLHGPGGKRLYVTDRPLHLHQFVVARLNPDDACLKPHRFVSVDEPNGIADPNDPVRASIRIACLLLPRYERALQTVRRNTAEQPEPPHRPAPTAVLPPSRPTAVRSHHS
ncbi:hypothetical protein [Streptomyces sp. NPDC057412]|uniref:hypothetical protein n=1 Tax=Streptomyces sp. NPDC057412 TaxID=3346123 RepID=UPI0036899D47